MLIETYQNIFNKTDLWKYYNDLPMNNNPFEDDFAARNFIPDYFQTGGKSSVLDSNIPADYKRDIHSISTFFLGILFKILFPLPDLQPDFRYIWFITCLYHDYGYYIENNMREYNPNNLSLETLSQKLGIDHNILNTNIKKPFSTTSVNNYYNLCRKEYHFINHGIVGGLLLYDRLKKNYINVKNEAVNAKKISATDDDFIYKGLRWSSKHEQYYKEAAETILSHNIWYAKSEISKELYRSKRLNKLIIENPNQRLSCRDYPLLFLLVLADTIEPIKAFNHLSVKCVLQKIDISVDKASYMINIKVIDECINYQSWFKKIIDLENWTKVSVSPNNNKLTIRIE